MRQMPIEFPGLFPHLKIDIDPVAVPIGHGIYWYGIIIGIGFLVAALFCARRAPRYGLTSDRLFDMLVIATPLSIIGARLYYVVFYLDLYRNADGGFDLGRAVAVWDGGLAIYGGVIAAVLTVFFFCRRKGIRVGAMLDLGVIGLFIGQMIGRWGNFVNREAFGMETTLPWRMRLWESEGQYIDVHPTFLYESLWNCAGLLILLFVIEKHRKFDGENFLFYLFWYGLGRMWIEGLRTDNLLLFGWELFGKPIAVSQLLSFILCVVGGGVLLYRLIGGKHQPLYVNESAEKREGM